MRRRRPASDDRVEKQVAFDRSPSIGIPLTSIDELELELIYHSSSTQSIHHHHPLEHPQGLKISITLTPNNTTSTHDHATPTSTPLALFLAHFDPPLPVSRLTAAELFRISNDLDHHPSYHPDPHQPSTPPREILLEDLLVHQLMSSNSIHQNHPHRSEIDWFDRTTWKHKRFGKHFKGPPSLKQVYSLLDDDDLLLPCSEDPLDRVQDLDRVEKPDNRIGFMINQVRFHNVQSLFKIIQVCQRQSIFNELFNSCFNSDCYLSKSSSSSNHALRGSEEDDIDPFVGLKACYFLSGNKTHRKLNGHLGLDTSLESHDPEISIDLILNHDQYSITIQFLLPYPRRLDPSARQRFPSLGEPSRSRMMSSSLISIVLQVSPDGSIELTDQGSISNLLPVEKLEEDPPGGGGCSSHDHSLSNSSQSIVACLERCANRTRCIPVILNCLLIYLHQRYPFDLKDLSSSPPPSR